MDYQEIQSYDCGMRGNPDFPSQQPLRAVKPTLKMVMRSVEEFAYENKYKQPRYNVEIKSNPKEYNVYTPEPKVFVKMILKELGRLDMTDQVTLQSFDVNVLEELNKIRGRKFHISYLVENGKSIKKNLALLTFKPDFYSPDFTTLKESTIKQAHDHGIKVIPWTVNKKEDIDRLISWGVDGIITDYPDLAPTVDKPTP